MEIEYDGGIRIKGTDLWLDADKKKDFCFVSHAHIDHAKRHKKILATPQTAKFYQHRLGETETRILEFNQPKMIKGAKVELFPSGHILGASQILVEKGGVRMVYTGDFKLRGCLTAERIQIKKCDILIMESTFGLPDYVFPPRKEVVKKLTGFVKKTLSQNQTPVVLAYSLGKAQEAMKILGDLGFKLSVHSSILKLASVYQRFGIRFKNCYRYYSKDLKGKVLLIPPWLRNSRMINNIPQKRVVMLTGWALDPGAKVTYGADELIPLSDHADFWELTQYVKRASPQKIYTLHGFTEFVSHLRASGYDAERLEPKEKPYKLEKELLSNYDLFSDL